LPVPLPPLDPPAVYTVITSPAAANPTTGCPAPTPSTARAPTTGPASTPTLPLPTLLPSPPEPPAPAAPTALDALLSPLRRGPPAPPASAVFPAFSGCDSLAEYLAAAFSLVRRDPGADSAGASLLAAGLGPDPALVSTHMAAVSSLGILSVLTSCSDSLAPSTLQALPADPPQLAALATLGGPLLLPDGFSPNSGVGVRAYPASTAPPNAIAAHFGRRHRSGEMLILPTAFARAALASADLPFHVSNPFIQPKPGTAIGRLVCDYTNSVGGGLNSDSKKARLRDLWGVMTLPLIADVSDLLLNCRARYPHPVVLFGQRMDVDKAHNRIRPLPSMSPLMALHLDIGAVPHVGIPLVNMFGLQDVNFQFDFASLPVHTLTASRLLAHHDCRLSDKYVDDFFQFVPAASAAPERAAFTLDAVNRFGLGAIAESKTLFGPAIEIIGWIWDTEAMTATISERMFAKLLLRFFHDLPDDIDSMSVIAVDLLHSLAGVAVRCANAMLALLPYSRGFHENLRGVPRGATTTRLSPRSKADIVMWRAALRLSLRDTRWLTIPVRLTVLHRRLPLERLDPLDHLRAARQASSADLVVFGDACLSHFGLGGYSPSAGWFSLALPELQSYRDCHGLPTPTDINVYEFIAALLAVTMTISHLLSLPHPPSSPHIHVWTDNVACRSWIQNHRSDHPLHSFLLQLYSLIQIKYSVVVTTGHVRGINNPHADCNSRLFHCPQAESVRRDQRDLPQYHPSPALLRSMIEISQTPSEATWNLAPRVLTLLDGVLGSASAPSMH
jgi:hypothetical protein